MNIRWVSGELKELSAIDLYQVFRLRQSVFILEQTCLYPDIDRLDENAIHLLGWSDDGQLIAYLRILAPGTQYAEPAIGRVVVSVSKRGLGIGRNLLDAGIRIAGQHFSNTDIRISAQSHLISLYSDAGFESVGQPYLEDDIPHQEMLRKHRA